MKKMKKFIALLTAAAVIISSAKAFPAEAKSKYYWQFTKKESYDYTDGKWVLNSTDSYSYNKKGQMTKMSFESNGSSWSYEYSYDKKGRTKKMLDYQDGALSTKTVYSYNKKGLMTKEKQYNSKKKLISTTKVKYDSKGNWTKSSTTFTDKDRKTLVDTAKYKYNGKKIKKAVYKYEYDDGADTRTEEYYKNGIIKKVTVETENYSYVDTYDKKGNITKSVTKNSISEGVTTYKYKDGLKVSETYTTKDIQTGETNTYEYTYDYKLDKNKNITESIMSINGTPTTKEVFTGYKKFKN